MHKGFKYLVFLALVIGASYTQAQVKRDSASFRVGVYAGYYVSGDGPARYYSGEDNNRLLQYINLPQIRPQIVEALGNYNFTFAEYAQDMAYQNEFSFELSAELLLKNYWYVAARLHSVRLAASGIFTLDVERGNQGGGLPNNLEQVAISGRETRSHIDIGVGKQIGLGKNLYWLVEAGMDINFVEPTANEFIINNQVFSLPLASDPLNPQANPGNTVGLGFYGLTGVGYELPGSLGLWFKFTYQQTNINVNRVVEENTGIVIPSVGFTKFF